MSRLGAEGEKDPLEKGSIEGVIHLVPWLYLCGVASPAWIGTVVEEAPDALHFGHVHVDEVVVTTSVVESEILGSDHIVALLVVAEITSTSTESGHVFSVDLWLKNSHRIILVSTKSLLIRAGKVAHRG